MVSRVNFETVKTRAGTTLDVDLSDQTETVSGFRLPVSSSGERLIGFSATTASTSAVNTFTMSSSKLVLLSVLVVLCALVAENDAQYYYSSPYYSNYGYNYGSYGYPSYSSYGYYSYPYSSYYGYYGKRDAGFGPSQQQQQPQQHQQQQQYQPQQQQQQQMPQQMSQQQMPQKMSQQ